ncbi:hypothetical protein J437_LFUL009393 [Ladona fulva]|uniref:Cytochrome P450 n=1 Tax=Ladona fulva TaxID=123851 RepID=A0A8K0P0A2_LADFU|nr:hypothetical protein J437_LFUL009393 [Ladona fulva]
MMWSGCGVEVTLAIVALVALFIYLTSNLDYWKKRGFPQIPGKPLPLFGNTFQMLTGRKSFSDMFEKLYKDAGDLPFAGMFHGTQPCLLVKDPELIKRILIKDFHAFMNRGFEIDEDLDPLNAKALSSLKGQRWKNMRARLSPTFTSGRMKAMLPMMQACSDELLKCLEEDIRKNSGEALVEMKLFMIYPKLIKKLNLRLSVDEASVFFRNFVEEAVKRREEAIDKGEGNGFGDFLHHLVLLKKTGIKVNEIKEEDDEDKNEFIKGDKEVSEVSWANISVDDLAAQAMLFFGAGFETTAALLSSTLYELSKPGNGKEIQGRVREEVDRVMKEDGGKITYEGLKRMQLLDRVLNETLRIHPPAGALSRIAVENYTIPGTDLKIEKNTMIFISTYSMQHDEKFFSEPSKFDPDRFLHRNEWNHFSFLPFGDGPRLCIGERFAMLQVRQSLASLLSKFEFDLCVEKTPVPLKYAKVSFILASETGIWVKAKLRS